MDYALSESVQQSIRPGKCSDLYYPDPETAQKQCYRTSQNTRFIQGFQNLSGGSQTLTIPPNNGIQDVVVSMTVGTLPAGSTGYALPRGWGYAMISRISYRYGGSSQYFLSQQQVLQEALRKAPNGFARDDLLALGGAALTNAQLLAGPASAYVWLPLPHCIPSADGKLPPIPSDLLTQQIQITVELVQPITKVYSAVGASGTGPLTSLLAGQFAVQQVLLENQGDALARRVDMSTHALSYPVNFTQQEVTIPLGTQASATSVAATLTGFRSGEVRNIQLWITADADTASAGGQYNPFLWYAPENVIMTYAGEIFARFDGASGPLWNLVNGRITPQVNDVLTRSDLSTQAVVDSWLECPFGQSYDALTAHSMYVSGKPITNGIVNLTFTMPTFQKATTAAAPTTPIALPSGTYTLHCSYEYNAVLLFSAGTAEYVL